MKDAGQFWYEPSLKAAVSIVDVTSAAQALANGHISGPVAAVFLARALALAALLGREGDAAGQVLSIQMKCSGPLGGWNVEYSPGGFLRGYTEKKLLDDFDGLGRFRDKDVVGDMMMQFMATCGGAVVSQAVAWSPEEYLSLSLQRRAKIFLEAEVSDDVRVGEARGVLVEALPDSVWDVSSASPGSIARAPRTILASLGLARAELKEEKPLAFACSCSAERARGMVASLPEADRKGLEGPVSVTCHMCGRTYQVEI